MSDEKDRPEEEGWREPPPPPPMPDFPEIPESLRRAAEGKKEERALTSFGTGWALALDFVGTIVAAWLIGFGVDWWQKTAPWGSLIGLGVGFASAVVRILRQSQREERRGR